jgi:hypothetical protein
LYVYIKIATDPNIKRYVDIVRKGLQFAGIVSEKYADRGTQSRWYHERA